MPPSLSIHELRSLLADVLPRLASLELEVKELCVSNAELFSANAIALVSNERLVQENIALKQENIALKQEHVALKQEHVALKQEHATLLSRLNKNSKNSNKPPSTEGLSKPSVPKSPMKGKQGGQLGHEGKSLAHVDKADFIEVHHASECSCCGKVFSPDDIARTVYARQVFDIPEPVLIVTEHRLGVINCCDKEHIGTFPEHVKGAVQYGINIKTLAVLLSTEYRLPFDKISQLFGDLFGSSMNAGTVLKATEDCFTALETTETNIREAILASPVAHFDETGMRVEGKLHWFHVACTTFLTYLFVHAKRGKDALLSDKSIIKDYANNAVHDCWASYFNFIKATHFLCGAHIQRELTALIEQGTVWAKEMHEFLSNLLKASQDGEINEQQKTEWMQKYEDICKKADSEEPPPEKSKNGRPKNSKGRNLLNRLTTHKSGILTFAFDKDIPFTNNQAERDIRHVKIKQKVAMSFRTFQGAEIYARIQGFVITTRKQKQNTFDELKKIIKGEPYTVPSPLSSNIAV
jgi:transposase